MDMPDVLTPSVPSHTTGPLTVPPALAKLAGTGKARPDRKISSSPETGTVVIQVLVSVSKVVEVHVALGEKVTLALGTAKLYAWSAVNWIVDFVKVMVAPVLGMPLAVKLALNQM